MKRVKGKRRKQKRKMERGKLSNCNYIASKKVLYY